jgi:hypothetical protein
MGCSRKVSQCADAARNACLFLDTLGLSLGAWVRLLPTPKRRWNTVEPRRLELGQGEAAPAPLQQDFQDDAPAFVSLTARGREHRLHQFEIDDVMTFICIMLSLPAGCG